MLIREAVTEFYFDCQIRKLSSKTIELYDRQLEFLSTYMGNATGITITVILYGNTQKDCSYPASP